MINWLVSIWNQYIQQISLNLNRVIFQYNNIIRNMSIRIEYDNGKTKVEGYAQHHIDEAEKKVFAIDSNQKISHALGDQHKNCKQVFDNIDVVLKPLTIQLVSKTSETVYLNSKNFTNNSCQTVNYDASISAQKQRKITSHWENLSAFSKIGQVNVLIDLQITEPQKTALLVNILAIYGQQDSSTRKRIIGVPSGISVNILPNDTIYVDLTGELVKTKFRIDYQVSLKGSFSFVQQTQTGGCLSQVDIGLILYRLGVDNKKKVTQIIEITSYDNGHITTSGKPKQ